jgi:hypothetical protein
MEIDEDRRVNQENKRIGPIGAVAVLLACPLSAAEVVDLSALGERGVVFELPRTVDLGSGLADGQGIGDFDGDGRDDIVLAFRERPLDEPRPWVVSVVYGSRDLRGKVLLPIDPGAAIRSLTVRIRNSLTLSGSIEQVARAGDVNGDGYSDVVYGLPYHRDERASGVAIVMHGGSGLGAEGFMEEIGSGLLEGTVLMSTNPNHTRIGFSIATLDFDGDGSLDVVTGAPGTEVDGVRTGMVFVVLGAGQLPPLVDLAQTGQSLPGTQILGGKKFVAELGTEVGDWLGKVGNAGDLEGDGFEDLLILAPNLLPERLYVVKGSASPPAQIDLAEAGLRNDVVVFQGPTDGRWFNAHRQAVGAGDVDRDGDSELLIGLSKTEASPLGSPNGIVHLFPGRSDFPNSMDLAEVPPGLSVAIRPRGSADGFGICLAPAGDLNFDGTLDLLIGAPRAPVGGKSDAGEAYAIFGNGQLAGDLNLKDGFEGARIQGAESGSLLGEVVSPIGDFNGDGTKDILVLAPGPIGSGPPGRAYVVFGIGSANAPLSLHAADPAWGPMRGGTTVILRGSGFKGTPAVRFGDQPASGVTALSGSELQVVVPAFREAGNVDVEVTIGAETSRLPGGYEYTENLPAIDPSNLGGHGLVLETTPEVRMHVPFTFGDLTGDGQDELILPADVQGPLEPWRVEVLKGGPGLPERLALWEPSERASILQDTGPGASGRARPAAVGDVNGDGLGDLGIGTGAGPGYVLFGRAGLEPEVDLSSEVNASWAVRLLPAGGRVTSFAPAGDLDRDGIADFALSSPAGELIFVPGARTWPQDFDASDSGNVLSRLRGSLAADGFVSAGDVNGDGFTDFLAMVNSATYEAYLLLGGEDLAAGLDMEIEAFVGAGGGTRIRIIYESHSLSQFSHAPAGDFNADGHGDLVIGDEGGGNRNRGITYVVFGRPEWPEALDLLEAPESPDGVLRIHGAGDWVQAGRVGPAGDFNADSHGDVLIAAPGTSTNERVPGNAFVVFGSAAPPDRIDLERHGGRGLRIPGALIGNLFAPSPATGDVNGDGRPDFALLEDSGSSPGRVYLIYGLARRTSFVRGDANEDGRIDLSDAVFILTYLFLGGRAPECKDAADVDDRGTVEITDAVNLLNHLFLGAAPPRPPHPAAGEDPTDDALDCSRF